MTVNFESELFMHDRRIFWEIHCGIDTNFRRVTKSLHNFIPHRNLIGYDIINLHASKPDTECFGGGGGGKGTFPPARRFAVVHVIIRDKVGWSPDVLYLGVLWLVSYDRKY